jgi:hypothetical protein
VWKALRRGCYPAFAALYCHAELVEGRLKGTDLPFRLLWADNSPFGRSLEERFFGGDVSRVWHRRLWIPSLLRWLPPRADICDLCVANLPQMWDAWFRGRCSFRTTPDVRQVIDTSGSWDDVRRRFATKRRQIANNFERKTGLSCRVTHAAEDFDLFYHRMFVPHITRRYGALATIDDYGEMRRFFEQGSLLLVTKDGRPIAGALNVEEDGVLRFRRTGVLDGDESHVEVGAQTALYYFQIRHANHRGLRALDTMKSACFLNDGVYRHKRDWGASVHADDEATTWLYLFAKDLRAEATVKLFADHPVAVHGERGLTGVVGLPLSDGDPDARLATLRHRYQAAGLDAFVAVTPSGIRGGDEESGRAPDGAVRLV